MLFFKKKKKTFQYSQWLAGFMNYHKCSKNGQTIFSLKPEGNLIEFGTGKAPSHPQPSTHPNQHKQKKEKKLNKKEKINNQRIFSSPYFRTRKIHQYW